MLFRRFTWLPKAGQRKPERIRVDVNPSTGGIAEFQHVLNRPDTLQVISPEVAQENVEAQYGGTAALQVIAVRLLNRFSEDNEVQPVWVVTYRLEDDTTKHLLRSGPVLLTCEVDASSGQILEELE